eukprot:scaffold126313_cov42-Phaeocystis_antarctica.AAC.1
MSSTMHASSIHAIFPDGIPSGEAAAKTPATSTARDGPYLLVRVRVRGQNMTEHNPAPSPSE